MSSEKKIEAVSPVTGDYKMLATQSLARTVSDDEAKLSEALIQIFREGIHDFERVVTQLNKKKVARPSGKREPWTVANLEQELWESNRTFDDAYANNGYGA